MSRWRGILAAAAAVLTALVAACGGGGNDGGIGGTGGGGSGGGIGGTGVAYGEIEGFGSVWVNGVRYDTRGAAFRLDDRDVTQDDLRIGMVARIEGSASAGTASAVTVDSAIKGRVEQVFADRLLVMGQEVSFDAQTRFEDNQRPVAGDLVEVHGLPAAGGVIAAAYVERKAAPASPPFAVTGFVAAHDRANATLTIGALTVNYAGADVGDMPAGDWTGLLVEVKGSACGGNPVCGTLTAIEVEPGGPRFDEAPKAEVEGFVTALTPGGFRLGGQEVRIDAATRFSNGSALDLRVGAKLEAEGPIANGVMTATEIEFRSGVRLEGDIASNGSGGFTLAGLPGITVVTNRLTELDNLSDPALLAPPNHVRVRGRLGPDNVVVATELELRSSASDPNVELRGPVEAIAGTVLTVLGRSVDVQGLSGATAALAGLAVGDAVELKGRLVGGAVAWEEVERED